MMNVEKITNEIIEFIRKYYKDNNLKGAVIGISGGKDSAVVAGLFAKAFDLIADLDIPAEDVRKRTTFR